LLEAAKRRADRIAGERSAARRRTTPSASSARAPGRVADRLVRQCPCRIDRPMTAPGGGDETATPHHLCDTHWRGAAPIRFRCRAPTASSIRPSSSSTST
jgi:hypothetical protein